MFKDRPDWGITPAFRHDGFDTRDWLIGKAGEIPERADPTTGFSPRGAVVEDGAPAFPYTETERDRVWAHNVATPLRAGHRRPVGRVDRHPVARPATRCRRTSSERCVRS